MKWYLRYGLVFSVALLLFPATLQTAHIFSGHEHFYCDHYSDSHFHKETTDCELLQFRPQLFPEFVFFSFEVYIPAKETNPILSSYCFLSNSQRETLSLRGPPISADLLQS